MTQVLETPATAPAATPTLTVPATSEPAAATPTPAPPATPGDPAQAKPVPKGAPEKYGEFKVPEGMTAQPEMLATFAEVAKRNGLTQEAAQEFVTFQMEAVKAEIAKYDESLTRAKAELPGLIAKDPELGGADAETKAATMQRAIVAFGSPELTKFLDSKETPNEAYIAIARFALKVGAAIKEDSVAGTAGAGTGDGRSFAERFYAKAEKPVPPKTA